MCDTCLINMLLNFVGDDNLQACQLCESDTVVSRAIPTKQARNHANVSNGINSPQNQSCSLYNEYRSL